MINKRSYNLLTQGLIQLFFLFAPFCGPGENRTPVQTRKPYAFYMLIFA